MAVNLSATSIFHISSSQHCRKRLNPFTQTAGNFLNLRRPLCTRRIGVHAVSNEFKREGDYNKKFSTNWLEEEKPYRILPSGNKFYMDELDIVTIVDPPKNLVPINIKTFDRSVYLWDKIKDIPEERRHRLLNLLGPTYIPRLWEIAGIRYKNASKMTMDASVVLSSIENKPLLPQFWSGKITRVPWPIRWMRRFTKALFLGKEGCIYGRLIPDVSLARRIADNFSPLYFLVRNYSEVMATEEPCDFAFEFGDGQLQLSDLPVNFPKPVKHPWPFDDQLVIYLRTVGPSVLVGQVWQEGRELEQLPQKKFGELLLIKDYATEENPAVSTTK